MEKNARDRVNAYCKESSWDRYRRCCFVSERLGLSVDVSRMRSGLDFLSSMRSAMQGAFDEMAALEAGGLANRDEGRMVGHYWLRAAELSPTAEIRDAIRSTLDQIRRFAGDVHEGRQASPSGQSFTDLVLIGIGGSALGPQFLYDALRGPDERLRVWFCDNTDPDGFDRIIEQVGPNLKRTLVLVISKSGGTTETRNGMLEMRRRFAQASLEFPRHAVAITQEGSRLDQLAAREQWLSRFPMWDWVGGRTSVTSAVGLLPAALAGYDIEAFLRGAADGDTVTRAGEVSENPAALLALMWFQAGGGVGNRHMVVLPYRDRLGLLARYLQQLVMESLGKRVDRDGGVVHQGLTVFGNKGSTDQHSFVQQLRDGRNDFFVTFVDVGRDRRDESVFVEPEATSGDYLHAFLWGTRQALDDAGRESITITLEDISERSLGVLVALFERAVGLYASLINVNAYDQPGVEAGKKAANEVIAVQRELLGAMRAQPGRSVTAEEWARTIGRPGETESVYYLLNHIAAKADRGVTRDPGPTPFDARYCLAERTPPTE